VAIDSSLNGGGPSEPGGAPEIEVEINGAAGNNDVFNYLGGPAVDFLGLGQLAGGDTGLNMTNDGDVDDVRSNAEHTQINLGAGSDRVQSAPPFVGPVNGVLTVNGDGGNDFIDGGLLTSILNGGEGDDNIGLFAGNNIVNGGPGDNGLFAFFGGALTVNQNAGVLDFSGSTLSGNASQIVDLFLQGSNGNDTLNADGVALPLLVLAGNGNDKVTAGSGDDDLFGDQGDDELRGRSGNDNLNGGEGNDSCEGETQTLCEILILDPVPNLGGGTQPPGTNNPLPTPLPAFNPFSDGVLLRGFTRAVGNAGIDGFLDSDGFFLSFQAHPGVYELIFVAPRGLILGPQSAGAAQRGKRIVLAKARKRVTTAGRVRMRVKPTRQGRRALRRARRVRITLSAKYTSPGGERYSASRKVTIKKKRKRR
jgi:Ca2+-binding RTX toxin-like protein